MAGIYIHIPFCKQACHYCDFHFSTSIKKKDEMIQALIRELQLRQNEFLGETIETIYFGGGTPSILPVTDIRWIIDTIYGLFTVTETPEITVEANPDDLSEGQIKALSENGINRLSIGIQSFFEQDLKLMNRAHNAEEALKCLQIATQYFDNISIDLIYGTPGMDNQRWFENIQLALNLGIPHISSYALTVEPKTALQQFIKKGMIPQPDDAVAHEQFLILVDQLEANGFIHYELSNFGKENYFSRNNSAYWLGKKYMGIGPSAHSYDGIHRSWNIANNSWYIKTITEDKLPSEIEELTQTDRYNEYVMTGLRTVWGVSLDRIETQFGPVYKNYLLEESRSYRDSGKLSLEDNILRTTRSGKFFSDGIASDLFFLD